MATIDYAAVCESIEQRPSLSVWPTVRRLGKNRVDVVAFPAAVKLPLLIATRLSAEEAEKGPQVLEILVEIFDVVAGTFVDRVELAEPLEDVSRITPGPVGFPILLTPTIEVTLPRSTPFLVRVSGWSGRYDFLLAAFAQSG